MADVCGYNIWHIVLIIRGDLLRGADDDLVAHSGGVDCLCAPVCVFCTCRRISISMTSIYVYIYIYGNVYAIERVTC